MSHLVVVDPVRAPIATVDRLASFGAATVHEAMGRSGYLGPGLRPVWGGARVAGTAVTVSVAPGDNLMAHVAVEQTRRDDILVVAPTSPTTDGFFGDVFATSLMQRGVRGLVTDTGVRDVADLRSMGFPVWSSAISAQGTVKASPGSVNTPIVIGAVVISAGDVVVADDDGVVCVPRRVADAVADACEQRLHKEDEIKLAMARGELGLDLYGLRDVVARHDIRYVSHADPVTRPDARGPA